MTDSSTIQKSYDQLPYDTCAYARTHPNRIGSLAHMMGMDVPSLPGAHVLEIGCADAGNLFPMAYGLPQTQCWGFDLSPAQIQRGQTDLDVLGLPNVRLDVARIEDDPYPDQKFDYIIAHGIYSWVPSDVQDKILSYISDRLTPNGLAFVSLNIYPGWHGRARVRDFIYHMCGREPHPTIQHGEKVMGFLQHMIQAHEAFPYGPMQGICDMAQSWSRMTPGLLAHGPLAELNEPCYFDAFAAECQQHGLSYVADAEDGWVTAQHPLFANLGLSAFFEAHPERMEQAIDFIRNQAFRRAILTRQTNAVLRPLQIDADRIKSLFIVGRATAPTEGHNLNSQDGLVIRQIDNDALSATVNHPVTKHAMNVLVGQPWRPIGFHELVQAISDALKRDVTDNEVTTLCRDLTQLFSHGLLELNLQQPYHLVGQRSPNPEAHPVARYLAGRQAHVPSYRHGTVEMNDFQRALVVRMDGTQTIENLAEALRPHLASNDPVDLEAAINMEIERLDDACLLARHR